MRTKFILILLWINWYVIVLLFNVCLLCPLTLSVRSHKQCVICYCACLVCYYFCYIWSEYTKLNLAKCFNMQHCVYCLFESNTLLLFFFHYSYCPPWASPVKSQGAKRVLSYVYQMSLMCTLYILEKSYHCFKALLQ